MDGERVDVVYGPQLEVPQEGDVASEASVEEPVANHAEIYRIIES